jgi:hypothetical protein
MILYDPAHCRRCALVWLQLTGAIPLPVVTRQIEDLLTEYRLKQIEKASQQEDLF